MNIKQIFLDYFKTKQHKLVKSSSLVPDDKTLLFTNAGMVQFKDIFIGEKNIPNNPRVTSSQLCIRAGGKHNDLDNVGYTARHHTMFEMLGNFSFGDYFKDKAIEYAWEFITDKKYLNLSIQKIWVTVHNKDEEAFSIWKEIIAEDRIIKLDDKDNFWSMGKTGACGYCSEIFYDQGDEKFNSKDNYIGGDGDRFLEIWNLVFMEFQRDIQGNLKKLPKPSIDTGMGLERVVAIKEGKDNNFHSSLFMPLIKKLEKIIDIKYENQSSFKVIVDHLRSASFLLSEGVNFDKVGRGYVLRRIMRRAIRYGYLLGKKEPFIFKLVDTLIKLMGKDYPQLKEKKELIKNSMKEEEKRFLITIHKGILLFNEEIFKLILIIQEIPKITIRQTLGNGYYILRYFEKLILLNIKDAIEGKEVNKKATEYETVLKIYEKIKFLISRIDKPFSGKIAFDLYDTYGFPLDLTQDMLREKNIKLDLDQFNQCMEIQKNSSRGNFKDNKNIDLTDIKKIQDKFGINEFIGYENIDSKSKVIGLFDEDFKKKKTLNGVGWIVFNKTPFYAESGGQIGDIGKIKDRGDILETKKIAEMNISKFRGEINIKDEINLIVDNSREEISKYHSATHLLNLALTKIVGKDTIQKGSLVKKDRLRFDFSHNRPLIEDEKIDIEKYVNNIIDKALESETKIMKLEDAKNIGAVGDFNDKYGDEVRVITIGGESIELCGGTHIKNSSEIGTFIILKESGVSAGVRRIEAICGAEAKKYIFEMRKNIEDIKIELKNKDILKGVNNLKKEIKKLKEELKNKNLRDIPNFETRLTIENMINKTVRNIVSKYQLDGSGIYLKDSDVLTNKLNITDSKIVHQVEDNLLNQAYQAYKELLNEDTVFNQVYFQNLHKLTFKSLYSWAGNYRNYNMAKEESRFCQGAFVEQELDKIFERLKKDNYLKDYKDKKEFSKKLAYYKCEIIAIHPFPELNGRILRMFFDLMVYQYGYNFINYSKTSRKDYIDASIDCVQLADCKKLETIIYKGLNKLQIIIEEIIDGDIKNIIDKYKNRYEEITIMLFQKKGDKILIACGTKGVDIKAGDWIKNIAPILNGKGGGRDDFAQAGGTNFLKLEEAKNKAFLYINEIIFPELKK